MAEDEATVTGAFEARHLGPWLEIVPSGPIRGRIAAPPSKSVTNRLLVVAGLAEGTSHLQDPLRSDDTDAMRAGLEAFGIEVEMPPELPAGPVEPRLVASVHGSGGRLVTPAEPVDARLSGTTLRFLAPLALLAGGTTVLDGSPSLRRRPIGGLADALRGLGAVVATAGGYPPITVTASGFKGGQVQVDAAGSSQFVSALLLAAPYAEGDLEVEVAHLGASGYVDLTIAIMRRFGAEVEKATHRYHVSCSAPYSARREQVEYDASAAAHLFALAMASGGEVTVENAAEGSVQPDAAIGDLFTEMGGHVTRRDAELTVAGPESPSPIEADLSGMPDQLPTLAALAALGDATSEFSGLSVTRGHETDRLEATASELRRLGATIETGDDWLRVRGGRLHGGAVDTHGDHRMAMAFTALGARLPGVTVLSPRCVDKTYPGFFEDARLLGLRLLPPST